MIAQQQFLSTDLLIDFVQIPAGNFLMGSTPDERGHCSDEGPQHVVTLDSFFMSRTPITQAQWREVAGWVEGDGEHWGRPLTPNPSRFLGDDRPVECVSWHEAMEFCSRLSQRTGRRYSLPTEAQWEYACRAGTTTPFAFGETLMPEQANFDSNMTVPVGTFPANAWGLHDMHGNVWEWCQDDWHASYEGAPTDGSAWVKGFSMGKSCAAVAGSTILTTAARLPATTTTPPMPATASASACVAEEDDSRQGKSSGVVHGSSTRCIAARPTVAATPPPMPTAPSASVCAAEEAFKVLRGGSWISHPVLCRSAYRNVIHPADAAGLGFRVCYSPT